MEDKEGI